jgi:hypothetical protein
MTNIISAIKSTRLLFANILSIGPNAGMSNTTGTDWVAIGLNALLRNVSGNSNTAIGSNAGRDCLGSNCIFLGSYAGANEAGSNKLYIDSSATTTPLIGGDFSTGVVDVAKGLRSTVPFAVASLPATAGFTASTLIFVANGLKPGEAAGAGTGVWCSPVGANWCLLNTTTVVAA